MSNLKDFLIKSIQDNGSLSTTGVLDVAEIGLGHDPRPDRSKIIYEIEDKHFWFEGRARLFKHIVEGNGSLASEKRILEVGCGSTPILSRLGAGWQGAGLDVSMSALEQAQIKCPQALLLRSDGKNIPFEDGIFDIVCMFDVLEHVEHEDKFLREIRRVLKPEGRLVLSVPAGQWLWSDVDEQSGHYRRYSKRSCSKALRRNGFDPMSWRRYQFVLLPLFAFTRIMARFKSNKSDAGADVDSELKVIPFVNQILRAINIAEARISRRVRVPWGTSVIAVAKRSARIM